MFDREAEMRARDAELRDHFKFLRESMWHSAYMFVLNLAIVAELACLVWLFW